jgi:hypothetical protein
VEVGDAVRGTRRSYTLEAETVRARTTITLILLSALAALLLIRERPGADGDAPPSLARPAPASPATGGEHATPTARRDATPPAVLTGRPARRDADPTPQGGQIAEGTTDEGLPLRVHCIDDLSGRVVSDVVVRGTTIRPIDPARTPEGDGWILALVAPGEISDVAFTVEAPAGYVAWEPQHFETAVGAWTRELELEYPLRHEADVRVSVLDHEGRPARKAAVEEFTLAGVSVSACRTDRLGPGVLRLRGVPFFRDAKLSIVASTKEPFARARGSAVLPAHPTGRTHVDIHLPPPSWKPRGGRRSLVTSGGGSRVSLGRGRSRHTGDAVVEVLRFDGSPASKALVDVGGRTARTDDAGRARFVELPIGEHDVVVRAHGLLPLSGLVVVSADRASELVLRESEGGAVDVYVTDARGDPLPFATIEVETPSKHAWVDEHGGRQRVDPFTDPGGYRRVERVEAGRLAVWATWGGRKALQSVVVREGRIAEVRVVLK